MRKLTELETWVDGVKSKQEGMGRLLSENLDDIPKKRWKADKVTKLIRV